jgi:hypothetical protein
MRRMRFSPMSLEFGAMTAGGHRAAPLGTE